MKDERGFILPITVITLFLLYSFVLFQVNQYTIEKKFLKEELDEFTIDNLLQAGIREIAQFVSRDDVANEGTFAFEDGEVIFSIKKISNNMKSIQITCKVNQKTRNYLFYYDIENEVFLPWVEG